MLFLHFKTIFSFSFYPHFLLYRPRFMVKFLIYIAILSMWVAFAAGNRFINKNASLLLDAFPQITVKNGVLISPEQRISLQIPNTSAQLILDANPTAQMPEAPANGAPLIWVHRNTLYITANGKTQQQTLPEQMTFTTDKQTLQKYRDPLIASCKLSFAMVLLVLIPLVMLFSVAQAFVVGLVFKTLRRSSVSYKMLGQISVLLLGPISLLAYINMWIGIPLYSLAQLFLCIIYMQQIFNVLIEEPHEN